MPDHPYDPKAPVFGGMKGNQLDFATSGCLSRNSAATTINTRTVPTFTNTITTLRFADSRIPMMRIRVTTHTMRNAGRLNTAVTCRPSANTSCCPGVPANSGGNWIPKSCRRLIAFALHPDATVAALKAYSSTRSQPITHAMNSPSDAYAYVRRAGNGNHRRQF